MTKTWAKERPGGRKKSQMQITNGRENLIEPPIILEDRQGADYKIIIIKLNSRLCTGGYITLRGAVDVSYIYKQKIHFVVQTQMMAQV